MLTGHAETIADAYDLGPVVDFSGPAARGELGEVWRLQAERGTWAIKRSFEPFAAADAHHAWNAEHPQLFSDMVEAWVTDRLVPPDLLVPDDLSRRRPPG